MSRPSLAQLLNESARAAEQERADKQQVERITAAVKAQLTGAAAKKAETSKPMSCPHCGEPLPSSWRTDPTTSGTDEDDDVNEPDEDDSDDDSDFDDRARKAETLKGKYSNRKLSLVDRILIKRGIDPFRDN